MTGRSDPARLKRLLADPQFQFRSWEEQRAVVMAELAEETAPRRVRDDPKLLDGYVDRVLVGLRGDRDAGRIRQAELAAAAAVRQAEIFARVPYVRDRGDDRFCRKPELRALDAAFDASGLTDAEISRRAGLRPMYVSRVRSRASDTNPRRKIRAYTADRLWLALA